MFSSSLMIWECSGISHYWCETEVCHRGLSVCWKPQTPTERETEAETQLRRLSDDSSDRMVCRLLTKQWEHLTARKHNSSCGLTSHTGGPTNQQKTLRNVSNNKIKTTRFSDSQLRVLVLQGVGASAAAREFVERLQRSSTDFKKIETAVRTIKYIYVLS